MNDDLKQAIKDKARQLGFILAGVTSCEPPAHYNIFENWLNQNMHATMQYLAEERSRTRRADPKHILPDCKSILELAIPYSPISDGGQAPYGACRDAGGESTDQHNQDSTKSPNREVPEGGDPNFKIASYALGDDYHDILPKKLKAIVTFIEEQLGHPIPNRYYTDSGPVLERELAQRAGLGWIGKNSMLINPQAGSTFFLAEILLGIELIPDEPFATDQCGICTRCITACPTKCILRDRILDARRCISYLTIENKDEIPADLRPQMGNWIFGCDICQQVCPWNRFSQPADSAFETKIPLPVLTLRHGEPRSETNRQGAAADLLLSSVEFNQRFKKSPIKRAKRRGYLRNVAVAIGNRGNEKDIPILEQAMLDDEALVREHAAWAMKHVTQEGILRHKGSK